LSTRFHLLETDSGIHLTRNVTRLDEDGALIMQLKGLY
jgi:hypothetical protein